MLLTGRITKEKLGRATAWVAECTIIGAFTQGTSRADAAEMLADCIATKIDPKLKVIVTETGEDDDGAISVLIDCDRPAALAAEVLGYQRQKHGLSLADVARKLGTENRNAYASYERGEREPSLGKFRELLAAVAPDLALTIGPR